MGHDVLFIEYSENYEACYDPSANNMTSNPNYGLRFIQDTFARFDLQNDWAYFDEHTNRWFGREKSYVESFANAADVVINLSGITELRPWVQKIPIRIFLDTDPLFTQIRILKEPTASAIAAQHTHHLTYAENIKSEICTIPEDGYNWQVTRQPIVLNAWKILPPNENGGMTTVMQWDSYKSQEFEGVNYGMKSKSFQLIEDLPAQTNQKFEIAVGSASAPKEYLKGKGWILKDPLKITQTALTYQRFISESKGEFTIAKHGYVASNSGWFSERSAAYLASGRCVITQETGFSKNIETGNGLFSFSNMDEALEAISELSSDLLKHSKSARIIAERCFDHELVLEKMLSEL